MEENLFLYAHGGSGNHGCEAIVRATLNMLGRENAYLISSRPEEDLFYDVTDQAHLIQDTAPIRKGTLRFLKAYLALKATGRYLLMDQLQYQAAFERIHPGDIALSVGGDNYCYADVEKYIMLQDMLLEKGAKTVLWGCSVEPDLLKDEKICRDLSRYALITARETVSYQALKKVNPNTRLVTDPAFLLDKVELPLPDGFAEGNTVGINMSPMIIENESKPGMAYQNYEALIDAILAHTAYQVALIPHVVWETGDDRKPLQKLYDKYCSTGRVVLLEDHNCMELKGFISRCRFFVGARTHATIAAYSTGVPTLVVGYSVKARGIAQDLFGTETNYVLPVQQLSQVHALSDAFAWLMEQEAAVRGTLERVMPAYRLKAKVDLTAYI